MPAPTAAPLSPVNTARAQALHSLRACVDRLAQATTPAEAARAADGIQGWTCRVAEIDASARAAA